MAHKWRHLGQRLRNLDNFHPNLPATCLQRPVCMGNWLYHDAWHRSIVNLSMLADTNSPNSGNSNSAPPLSEIGGGPKSVRPMRREARLQLTDLAPKREQRQSKLASPTHSRPPS